MMRTPAADGTNDEAVLYVGRGSPWSLAPEVVLGLLTLGCYGLGLVFLLYAWMRHRGTTLVITEKRLLASYGSCRWQALQVPLAELVELRVERSFLGRCLGYGHVFIEGREGTLAVVTGLDNPGAVTATLDMWRRRRGLNAKLGTVPVGSHHLAV